MTGDVQRLELRLAGPDDAEAIARLHTDSWRRTYRGMYTDEFLDGDLIGNRRAVWRERLERPADNQGVYVATADGALAGFICIYGGDDPHWGSFVDNLHVSLGVQRRGIGSALMAAAADWFATHHPELGVYLWVMEANDRARRFYEALGASHVETVDREVNPGGWGRVCRYVWSSRAQLSAAAHERDVVP